MQNDLLQAMETWYREHAALLRASGVEIAWDHTEGSRPKHAQWIRARGPAASVELILWDTGEAESGIARLGMANMDEHHKIASVAQLEELLERLVNSTRVDA
jgi:hypothetical protein